MPVVFKAIDGTVGQSVVHTPAVAVRPTGAKIADNEAIKLIYVHFEFDLDQLYPAAISTGYVSARMEYGPGWEVRFDVAIGNGSFETAKDIFLPDSFPEFLAEDLTFSIHSDNIEALQVLRYWCIYEIVKAPLLEVMQATENYKLIGVN
jgi:hypothetical protein